MTNRKLKVFGALVVFMLVLILFFTGSPLLELALDENDTIPLGNFITWAGIIALPLAIYWSIAPLRHPTNAIMTILSNFLKLILVSALLWFPISYLLAGNFTFSFSDKATFQGGQTAMRWFWGISFAVPLGSLFILFMCWISLAFKSR